MEKPGSCSFQKKIMGNISWPVLPWRYNVIFPYLVSYLFSTIPGFELFKNRLSCFYTIFIGLCRIVVIRISFRLANQKGKIGKYGPQNSHYFRPYFIGIYSRGQLYRQHCSCNFLHVSCFFWCRHGYHFLGICFPISPKEFDWIDWRFF